MKKVGRWLLAAVALAVLAVLVAGPARAAFPERTVHFVVPYAPGGITDLLARILAQKLGEKWGQAVVVENRPGGNGTVAQVGGANQWAINTTTGTAGQGGYLVPALSQVYVISGTDATAVTAVTIDYQQAFGAPVVA